MQSRDEKLETPIISPVRKIPRALASGRGLAPHGGDGTPSANAHDVTLITPYDVTLGTVQF